MIICASGVSGFETRRGARDFFNAARRKLQSTPSVCNSTR